MAYEFVLGRYVLSLRCFSGCFVFFALLVVHTTRATGMETGDTNTDNNIQEFIHENAHTHEHMKPQVLQEELTKRGFTTWDYMYLIIDRLTISWGRNWGIYKFPSNYPGLYYRRIYNTYHCGERATNACFIIIIIIKILIIYDGKTRENKVNIWIDFVETKVLSLLFLFSCPSFILQTIFCSSIL